MSDKSVQVKILPSVTDYLLLELFLVNVTAVFHPIPAEPTIAITR